jgi:hypothetical protein
MAKLVMFAVVLAGCAAEPAGPSDVPPNPLKGGDGKADAWHCPTMFDEPEGYDGLVGAFARTAPIDDEIATIVFETLEDGDAHISVDGDYTVSRGSDPTTKHGRYTALPMNAAIGAVLLLTDDGAPTTTDIYWVMGIARTGADVTSLCLLRPAPDATAFVLERS